MATRAIVRIELVQKKSGVPGAGTPSRWGLYHHYDGYPENMMGLLRKAYDRWVIAGRWDRPGQRDKAVNFIIAEDPSGYEIEPYDTEHGDAGYEYHVFIYDDGAWEVNVPNYGMHRWQTAESMRGKPKAEGRG
ncbi:MAG: hypothetical protein V3W44_05125 [Dehalococcoidales bacterium]